MVASLLDVLRRPPPCVCDCHNALTFEERVQGIVAMFRFDDAMRGWGYTPLYHPLASRLWREAQQRNDRSYRGIAVRDEACVNRRLVGFAVHELIHALEGDTTQANYGIPFGLPYGVPEDLPESEEETYLNRFNVAEARAWVGVAPVAGRLFAIEWPLRTARDVGTYGFPGGNAAVDVPTGFRSVLHIDRQLHPQRYYAFARRLEDAARTYFTDAKLEDFQKRFESAERIGCSRRKQAWPDARELARGPPSLPGRNEPCLCGSGLKFKNCCSGAYAR